MKRFKTFLESGGETGWVVEVSKTPLPKAVEVSSKILVKHKKSLYDELPEFDKNYQLLYKSVKNSLGTLRRDMPVINTDQIDQFVKLLREGKLDIFKPFTDGKQLTPEMLASAELKSKFLELGVLDGNAKDDVVKASFKKVKMGSLKPIQEQIYLDKVMDTMIGKFGAVTDGSFVTNLTLIVSQDGYIIDGHHRFAAVMVSDPNIKQKVLVVPLGIKDLLKVTLAYGDAIGNSRNV